MPQIINETPGLLAGLQNASNSLATAQGLQQSANESQARVAESEARQQQYAQRLQMGNQEIAANELSLQDARKQQEQQAALDSYGATIGALDANAQTKQAVRQQWGMAPDVAAAEVELRRKIPLMGFEEQKQALAEFESFAGTAQKDWDQRQFANMLAGTPAFLFPGGDEQRDMLLEGVRQIAEGGDLDGARKSFVSSINALFDQGDELKGRQADAETTAREFGISIPGVDLTPEERKSNEQFAALRPSMKSLIKQRLAGTIDGKEFGRRKDDLMYQHQRYMMNVNEALGDLYEERSDFLEALSEKMLPPKEVETLMGMFDERMKTREQTLLGMLRVGGAGSVKFGDIQPDGSLGGGDNVGTGGGNGEEVPTEYDPEGLAQIEEAFNAGDEIALEDQLQKVFGENEDDAAKFLAGVQQSAQDLEAVERRKRVVGAVAKPVTAAAKAGTSSLLRGVTSAAGIAKETAGELLTSAVLGDEKSLAKAVAKVPTIKLQVLAEGLEGVRTADTKAQVAFIEAVAPDAKKLLDKAKGSVGAALMPFLVRLGTYLSEEQRKRR